MEKKNNFSDEDIIPMEEVFRILISEVESDYEDDNYDTYDDENGNIQTEN